MHNVTYTIGHEFNVVGITERGWDLQDDEGNRVDETLMFEIENGFEPI